jgi:hypothetical protein
MEKSNRVILRIEVRRGVPESLARVVGNAGSTNLSVQSRLVEFVTSQDDVFQAVILGLHPESSAKMDMPKRLLKKIVADCRAERRNASIA